MGAFWGSPGGLSCTRPLVCGTESTLLSYPRETVTEVLAANDIVDVVGAALDLKPSGSNRFLALCPFHQEKTPSFSVSRERQMFYCFGCGKAGDAISFLREHEGLTFAEALRKLADRGGVRLPALSERADRDEYQRTQLLELGKFARKFYRNTLDDPLKGGVGRRYLKTRQLRPETVKRFGLGYAPDAWNAFGEAAAAAGFKERILETSGLVKRGDRGRQYDFFRNRLMFPIQDVSGNVVAFGGRDLGGENAAKYINTPENPVYKKGRVLFGLHEARPAMRAAKRAVLVEGYFDALRCFDSGIENVVAPCGTALTSEQAALLRRYVPEAIVLFDGDAAGVRAAARGIGVLVGAGLTVRATLLPAGQDPDDYVVEHGVEAFESLLAGALDFVAFYVRANEERLGSVEGRTGVAHEIFDVLSGVDDALRRDEYLKRTARELKLSEWALRSEFSKHVRSAARRTRRQVEEKAPVALVAPDDRDFVASLLKSDGLRERVRDALGSVEPPAGPSAEPLAEVLAALCNEPAADVAALLEGEEAKKLYAAAANVGEAPANAETLVERRLRRFRKDALEMESARLQQAIQEAERAEDTVKVRELLTRKVGIAREIEELAPA